MCGITGFVDLSAGRSAAQLSQLVTAMSDTMEHRGPDDFGLWTEPERGVALGFRRLAIQDLTPDGAQPMESATGRYTIVFNGEIYNFLELRRTLDEVGAANWRGRSDTEVLLAAITHWGIDGALERFDGMFAIALWDREERRLSLMRDRMGEKPLYFGWAGKSFVFGSELKAIAAHEDFVPEIEPRAVAGLLRYGYVPAPVSIYRGIHKLAPGERLDLDGESGEIARSRYWDPIHEIESATPFEGSEEDASKALESLMLRSVSRRMLADVPLGAFLSGGIDSSAVVAMMVRASERPVKTYTVGFTDRRYDESPHAKAVANHLGTEHTEVIVDPMESLALIERLPFVYDEPFADVSQLPTLMLSILTRKHVTTALTGDGGDELFGGYPRYAKAARQWQTDRPMSKSLMGVIPFGPLNLISSGFGKPGRFGDKLWRKLSDRTKPSIELLYEGYMSRWRTVDQPMGDPGVGYFVEGTRRPQIDDDLMRLMAADTVSYLPDDLLVKVDRASMAASLETRAPLLSHDIARFAWSLPTRYKVRDGKGKRVLQSVLNRHVPSSIIDRPKQGFEPPVADWLRGPLRDWAQSLISGSSLDDGLIDPEPVRAVWEEHLKGQRNWHFELWNILMLQAWRRAWNI